MTAATNPATAPASIIPAAGYYRRLDEQAGQLTADDRLALTDLVLRFEWCYDRRDYDALGDMLTQDAVIDHVWGYREGRAAFLQLLRDWEYANRGLRHQGINLVVWPEPDGTAGAQSYLFGVTVVGAASGKGEAVPSFGGPAGHGLVTDRFRKDDAGLWRMTRRTIDQMYVSPAFLPNDDARRWFALSADERLASVERPPGWDAP